MLEYTTIVIKQASKHREGQRRSFDLIYKCSSGGPSVEYWTQLNPSIVSLEYLYSYVNIYFLFDAIRITYLGGSNSAIF